MPKNSDDKLINERFNEYKQIMFKTAMGVLHNKFGADNVIWDVFL